MSVPILLFHVHQFKNLSLISTKEVHVVHLESYMYMNQPSFEFEAFEVLRLGLPL